MRCESADTWGVSFQIKNRHGKMNSFKVKRNFSKKIADRENSGIFGVKKDQIFALIVSQMDYANSFMC